MTGLKKYVVTLVSGSNAAASGEMRSMAFLLTIEGILIALIINLIINNNLLFAMRLGADDNQIGLLASLPQFVGMLLLIPAGIITDRLKNKRKIVVMSLLLLNVSYIACSFVPFLGGYRFEVFLLLISISMGPFTIYNTSWQAYFSDITPVEKRNHILTSRNRWTFLISIFVPLVSGGLLASADSNNGKIAIHQAYFWVACGVLLFQVYVLSRIKSSREGRSTRLSLADFRNVLNELAKNKKFLIFVGIALYFYLTWQFDWTLYFIGQVKYLKMNEAWLSYVNIGGALMQFATIGFWSRVNEKRGVRFGVIAGSIGLACCPLVMIISTSAPSSAGPVLFLLLNTLANVAFATIPLNLLQCLLQVIPDRIKTISISIYTLFITFSNAVMPMAGVGLYSLLGGDLAALHRTFTIIFFLRIIAVALWTLRWYTMRQEKDEY